MSAPVLPADAWGPVPMRWRHVQPGDVVLDPDGRPWMVTALADGVHTLDRGRDRFPRQCAPDDVVRVLVPLAERTAVGELHAAGLGPTVVERRTA